jgi:hypothetical protein
MAFSEVTFVLNMVKIGQRLQKIEAGICWCTQIWWCHRHGFSWRKKKQAENEDICKCRYENIKRFYVCVCVCMYVCVRIGYTHEALKSEKKRRWIWRDATQQEDGAHHLGDAEWCTEFSSVWHMRSTRRRNGQSVPRCRLKANLI